MTTLVLPLPAGFRTADFLAFHARDPLSSAEQVFAERLEKGITLAGRPTRLELSFDGGKACLSLDAPGEILPGGDLRAWAWRFLGLDQPTTAFEAGWRDDPLLGPVLARHPGLRIPQAASPFEALSWAITGQQISLAAAFSLRRRLIASVGLRTAGGLDCYPDARALSDVPEEGLRAAGFSRAKAATLLEVARLVACDELPLDTWWTERHALDTVRTHLLGLKGIGPWTVDYTLLRGFGHADASLHGDAAVRRGLGLLLAGSGSIAPSPGPKETEAWLHRFAPWRSLVAAHLWRL